MFNLLTLSTSLNFGRTTNYTHFNHYYLTKFWQLLEASSRKTLTEFSNVIEANEINTAKICSVKICTNLALSKYAMVDLGNKINQPLILPLLKQTLGSFQRK